MPPDLNILFQMTKVLSDDADDALDRARKEQTQFCRRTYVRALFAYFEGVCFLMRQYALDHILKKPLTNDLIPTIAALQEYSVTISEKGEPRIQNLRTPLRHNLTFSFRAFSEASDVAPSLDKSGAGYQAFDASIKIRDRITHPKSAGAMDISDDEIELLDAATNWFMESLNNLIKQAGA